MRLLGAMLLCLALAACASKGNWKYNEISSGSSEFNSSRLSFVALDSPARLQLEILRTKNACRGYLYVHSVPILANQNDTKTSTLSILIGEETLSFLAQRHEGGHRILLSEEALSKIVNSLKQGLEVTLSTSGYQTTLNPQGFASQYEKFQKNPHFFKLL